MRQNFTNGYEFAADETFPDSKQSVLLYLLWNTHSKAIHFSYVHIDDPVEIQLDRSVDL